MLSKEEVEARVGFSIPEDEWAFNPWGNRILVKRLPSEEVTMGGIIIPNTAQQMKTCGVIVKVGFSVGWVEAGYNTPGQVYLPLEYLDVNGDPDHDKMIGEVVTFGMFSGVSVEDDYEGEWLLLMAMDILGVNNKK